MDEPKYSILLSGQDYKEWSLKIRIYLNRGVKVYWIGDRFNESSDDGIIYGPYLESYLLINIHMNDPPKDIIIDGEINEKEGLLNELSTGSDFDSEQYLVEHCDNDANIIVRASAGTGKTTVMMNRIMFLMHTIPGLQLSDIAMITFTNESSNEMRRRLQKILMDRFALTHNTRYMEFLEQQSGMIIGTIHSFELALIKQLGVEMGLSKSTEIKSLSFEINELVDEILGEMVDYSHEVKGQIGAAYYEVRKMVIDFWKELSQKGYDLEAINNLNWGDVQSEEEGILQETIIKALQQMVLELKELKRKNDSVLLIDMQCDLKKMISTTKVKRISDIKYLFVDEFQDTDDAQIAMIAGFVRDGIHILAVGDIKQSIYRFRGANSNSFQVLGNGLANDSNIEIRQFELFYNYRSSPEVLNPVNDFFTRLSRVKCVNSGGETMIQAFRPLKAVKKGLTGKITIHRCGNQDRDNTIINIIKKCIRVFDERHEGIVDESDMSEKEKVVALVRNNWQLNELELLCSKNDIPAIVSKDGGFFQSDAVRDFKAMLGAFIYTEDPIHLFNYLECPFSGEHGSIDLNGLTSCHGDRNLVLNQLIPTLNQTPWDTYKHMFLESPALSVLEHMVSNIDVIGRYNSIHGQTLMDMGYSGANLAKMLKKDSLQYSKNLKKLLELLYKEFKTIDSGCHDIYDYLSVQIATNHDEKEAIVADEFHRGCIHCMTVHASKGLEFDTVVIPYTDTGFHHFLKTSDKAQNQLTVGGDNVGWIFTKGKLMLKNRNYDRLLSKECNDEKAEETRLLYVAMTRPIINLDILLPNRSIPETWSKLIEDDFRWYDA